QKDERNFDIGYFLRQAHREHALALARRGDGTPAFVEADRVLQDQDALPVDLLFGLATVYARAAAADPQDAELTTSSARRATDLWSQAGQRGFFGDPSRFKKRKEDTDLNPIGQRDDFKRLPENQARPARLASEFHTPRASINHLDFLD